MLAQNFKTASDLRITEDQKDALCKTLVLLETGKLQHVPMGNGVPKMDLRFSGQFNMNQWSAKNECGTIACIGGTAELVGNRQPDELLEASGGNRQLRVLFYPEGVRVWREITVDQAARALRSYLTTGCARWDLAVSI